MAAISSFPAPKSGETKPLLNPYQIALEQLAPLEPLLAGFNRRNKSQHRRARWWASFNMLRRGLTKFLLELLAAAKSRAANSSGTLSKSGKPRKYEDQGLVDRVRERARWMRDVLLHKCYLQFSQLTADNQFATLGVVLLGVLGQVRVGCCGIVGDRETEDSVEMTEKVVGGKVSRDSMATAAAAAVGASGGSVVERDRLAIRQGGGGGGVISREDAAAKYAIFRKQPLDKDLVADEFDGEKQQAQQRKQPVNPAVAKRKRDEENTTSAQKQAKPKVVSNESNDDDDASRNETPPHRKKNDKNPDDIAAIFEDASSRPSKKFKRSAKEESSSIDDIFASTTTKTKSKSKDKEKVKNKSAEDGAEKKKKKKKKAGKGNEFDDMFSSIF